MILAGQATGTALGIALALGTVACTSVPTTAQVEVPRTAEATPTAQSDTPPCGFDVYKGKVYVTSLGKAHGTARVVKLGKHSWQDIGTLVDSKRIKRGQTITVKRPKHTKANRITVDIVKGKLTRNESPRPKVWRCDPA